MLTIPVISALNISGNKSNEEIAVSRNSYLNNEKPDLKIYALYSELEQHSLDLYQFDIHVLNCGTASINGGRRTDSSHVKITPINSNTVIRDYGNAVNGNFGPHKPGEIDKNYFNENPSVDESGIYRCYFWIDSWEDYDELDEDNNGAWSYYYLSTSGWVRRIGSLKPWNGKIPRNKVINNPLFIEFIDGFIDRFPLFARPLRF